LSIAGLRSQLRQLALDLEFGLPPMILGPSVTAACALPNVVGPHANALFLVTHSSTSIKEGPLVSRKQNAILP